MSGCVPSTNITASWSNPDLKDETYDNLLVTAMVSDISSRQYVEDKMTERLAKEGGLAAKSLNLFAPKLRDGKKGRFTQGHK